MEIFSVGYEHGHVLLWVKENGEVLPEPIRMDLGKSLSITRQILAALPEANR